MERSPASLPREAGRRVLASRTNALRVPKRNPRVTVPSQAPGCGKNAALQPRERRARGVRALAMAAFSRTNCRPANRHTTPGKPARISLKTLARHPRKVSPIFGRPSHQSLLTTHQSLHPARHKLPAGAPPIPLKTKLGRHLSSTHNFESFKWHRQSCNALRSCQRQLRTCLCSGDLSLTTNDRALGRIITNARNRASNRHKVRLEIAVSATKQTTGDTSNRHTISRTGLMFQRLVVQNRVPQLGSRSYTTPRFRAAWRGGSMTALRAARAAAISFVVWGMAAGAMRATAAAAQDVPTANPTPADVDAG